MKRSSAIAFLLAFVATPGSAQSFDASLSTAASFDVGRLSEQPRPARNDPVIAVRLIEYAEPRGSIAQQRGLIVGRDLSSSVSVGVGLLEMKPRRSTLSPDPQLDGSSRRSRKAAIRLTLKF